ncbi:sensor histidine kinase [Catellatospora sp. KI3]|uniref:sensor histidine kinase n=1 Tax=Catellatospora sp. KI3 TaxID=3041620 RepID=UPI002482E029|nr:sensor histidine kinase [Catellatospora sp. KI3]MDI1466062.1 sensor histidine kinase [Catellatospora sp. KI3]
MRWRRIGDVILVSWLLVAALWVARNWIHNDGDWEPLDTRGIVLICAFVAPLYLRAYAPIAMLAVSYVVSAVYLTLGYYHSAVTFTLALAVFTVAEQRSRRQSVAAAVLSMLLLLWAQHRVYADGRVLGALIALFMLLVGWMFGDNTNRLAERGQQLAELTARLRREQQERAHQAVSNEQGRIARELHDVVAHHMSVISVQAGLGRYVLGTDPDTTHRALAVIADTAHEALSEMRRMLAVLRVSTQDTPFDAAPALDRLPQLLERVRAAGAAVELVVAGEELPLPPGLGLCVYRVIQESLTNVLKHADPPEATVTLRWSPQRLEVLVADEGRRPPVPSEPDTVQHGLIGMRERARIYGGVLSTGPRPEGGFLVSLSLPLQERSDD